MPDVEKVIKELEEVIAEAVYPDRPRRFMMPMGLAERVLGLLKAQEPVVMAGAELTDAELIEEIRKAPLVLKQNVDAVPVVRCRDCKHWCRCDDGISGTCGALGGLWDENEFCSDGERRDDE